MTINVRIERLILDRVVPLAPGGRPALQRAVEAELSRLVRSRGLGDAPPSDRNVHEARPVGLRSPSDGSPVRLGERVARAVYRGMRE
jgi:hypothetical protein